jgi:hypothetical protein
LIELAEEAQDLPELVREWLFELNRGLDASLELKVLFQFHYADLGQIFNLSFKEVTQALRSQRAALLGSYLKREASQAGGISCFLVDQLLSPWVDSEWDNLAGMDRLGVHLLSCPSCSERLQLYRDLNSKILQRRGLFPLIRPEEWGRVLRLARQRRRFQAWRAVFIVALILGGVSAALLVLSQRPEKTPNVYEITEP